jgi:hypothetical protein
VRLDLNCDVRRGAFLGARNLGGCGDFEFGFVRTSVSVSVSELHSSSADCARRGSFVVTSSRGGDTVRANLGEGEMQDERNKEESVDDDGQGVKGEKSPAQSEGSAKYRMLERRPLGMLPREVAAERSS